jgi:hypothetical protein
MAQRNLRLQIILKMKVVDISLIAIICVNLQITNLFRVEG